MPDIPDMPLIPPMPCCALMAAPDDSRPTAKARQETLLVNEILDIRYSSEF
jgi:hypothetical protein